MCGRDSSLRARVLFLLFLMVVVGQLCVSFAQPPSCSTPADIIPLVSDPSDSSCNMVRSLPALRSVVTVCMYQLVHFNWTSASYVADPMPPNLQCHDSTSSIIVGDVIIAACPYETLLQYNARTHQLVASSTMGGLVCASVTLAYTAAMGTAFYVACSQGSGASALYLAQIDVPSSATLLLSGSGFSAVAVSHDAQLVYVSGYAGLFAYQSSNWAAGGVQLASTGQVGDATLLLAGSQLAGAGFLSGAVISALQRLSESYPGVILIQNGTVTTLLPGSICSYLLDVTVDPSTHTLMVACASGLWTVEFGAQGPVVNLLVPGSICQPTAVTFDSLSQRLLVSGCGSATLASMGGVSIVATVPAVNAGVMAVCLLDSFFTIAVGSISGAVFLPCGQLFSIRGGVVTPILGVSSSVAVAADESRGIIVASCSDSIVVIDDGTAAVLSTFPLPSSCVAMGWISLVSAHQIAFVLCPVSVSSFGQLARLNYSSGEVEIIQIPGCSEMSAPASDPLISDAYIGCYNTSSHLWWLVRISASGTQTTFSLPGLQGLDTLTSMLFDPRSSQLLIGGNGGVMLFNPITGASITVSAGVVVEGLAFDASYNLYVSTSLGILQSFSSTFVPQSQVTLAALCKGLGPVTSTNSGVVFVGCPGIASASTVPFMGVSSSDFVCPDGFFWSNLVCSPCPIGTARGSNTDTRFQCEPCAPGSVAPLPGMASCTVCEAGQFAASPQAPCIFCPDNSASSAGSVVCIACAAGQRAVGATCENCPAGRYSFGLTSNCTACDDGWVSGPGASHCTPAARASPMWD